MSCPVGTGVATTGGIVPVLSGIALAWGLSFGTRYVWAKVDFPRYYTPSQVWQAMKLAVGWTSRALHAPCWVIEPHAHMDIQIYAPDMVCSITLALFVEPCSLQGHFYERR